MTTSVTCNSTFSPPDSHMTGNSGPSTPVNLLSEPTSPPFHHQRRLPSGMWSTFASTSSSSPAGAEKPLTQLALDAWYKHWSLNASAQDAGQRPGKVFGSLPPCASPRDILTSCQVSTEPFFSRKLTPTTPIASSPPVPVGSNGTSTTSALAKLAELAAGMSAEQLTARGPRLRAPFSSAGKACGNSGSSMPKAAKDDTALRCSSAEPGNFVSEASCRPFSPGKSWNTQAGRPARARSLVCSVDPVVAVCRASAADDSPCWGSSNLSPSMGRRRASAAATAARAKAGVAAAVSTATRAGHSFSADAGSAAKAVRPRSKDTAPADSKSEAPAAAHETDTFPDFAGTHTSPISPASEVKSASVQPSRVATCTGGEASAGSAGSVAKGTAIDEAAQAEAQETDSTIAAPSAPSLCTATRPLCFVKAAGM